MDRETAQTLGELERKLGELERELAAVGGGNHSRLVDEAAQSGAPAAPAPSAPPMPAAPTAPRSPLPPTLPTPTAAPAPQPSAPPGSEDLLRFRERLEQTAADLTRDYDELLGRLSYATVPPSTATSVGPAISFARGAPSLDIVDVQGLREASARALESDPGGATAYGTSAGYLKLRAWIAEKHGVAPENVIVTNGSMQADAFLFEQLVGAGDEVVVERPTYDRTLLSLRKRGARVHAVQLETDGIDTVALARLLEGPAGAQPKLAHVIPNFQNPAGYTLSAAKRRALLELAARYGFVVFEDDPYVELRFAGEPIATMLSMDPERVVYASSFSKTVCPGIRVGYLVGPRDLIASIAALATNTYISPSMIAQAIVYEFCASGAIERSIATVKSALAQRVDTLAQALRRELPEAEFVPPQGGYFMWVTLPPGTDVATLFKLAAERGVAFVKGTDFLLEGGENTLRLAYSGVTPEQIDEGVARLAAAYRSL
ncbi:MAG TPA: PLP-dependent aminotransferase family protein [Solirubrobacteraceae bacterium]|jgi:DNA-binding transcriptional MocR family regulator